MGRRPGTVVAALSVAFLMVAQPVAADPAGPTNYRSTVTSLDAPTGSVEADVIGGDAFLVLHVSGADVRVAGYEGEPYLWFSADGTVRINDRSPARWLNDARYGPRDVDVPPTADATAPPRWRPVASDGRYAWHDHRIHYMAPTVPRNVDAAAADEQRVFDWEVPIVVDGEPAVITGTLVWVPSPSPMVPAVVGLVTLAATVAALRLPRRAAGVPALVGAGVLAATGIPMVRSIPAGAEADLMIVALPLTAGALALLGEIVQRRDEGRATVARWLTGAAAVPVVVWAVLLAGSVTRPIVPGPLGTTAVRVAVTCAFASAGMTAVAAVVRR